MWEQKSPATAEVMSVFTAVMPAKLTELDFAGMPAVKTCDVSWAGAVMSSSVGVASQAVAAACDHENQAL